MYVLTSNDQSLMGSQDDVREESIANGSLDDQ